MEETDDKLEAEALAQREVRAARLSLIERKRIESRTSIHQRLQQSRAQDTEEEATILEAVDGNSVAATALPSTPSPPAR